MSVSFDAKSFTLATAKPLPIVLLLDTSGSMAGAKIATLNDAVGKMLRTLTREHSQVADFLVSIITFGGTAMLAQAPTLASDLAFSPLGADGGTPLGAALKIAKELIEDQVRTPRRAFRPLVVLISDGMPTDEWESSLDRFVANGRSSKCDRMALGIGPEAVSPPGRNTLDRFIDGTDRSVFEAAAADDIHEFFRFVTMSVVTRSRSQDPNVAASNETVRARLDATSEVQVGRTSTPRSGSPGATGEPLPSDDSEDSYW